MKQHLQILNLDQGPLNQEGQAQAQNQIVQDQRAQGQEVQEVRDQKALIQAKQTLNKNPHSHMIQIPSLGLP